MSEFRAIVEYDGTDYHGFQIQVGVPTIQEELERAIARITGEEARVVGAGRTDTGVHATGQVIAFSVSWRHGLEDLQRALNAVLPAAMVIRDLAAAPAGFHPRFSASSRIYCYRVLNQLWRSPIQARFAHHVAIPLDVEVMNAAAAVIVGRHDFAAFGQPPQGENTVRRVLRSEWQREGDRCSFTIEADAFLRGMVRSLVGTLLLVGQGPLSVDEFAGILASCDRGRAAPPAPSCGLSLVEVKYER